MPIQIVLTGSEESIKAIEAFVRTFNNDAFIASFNNDMKAGEGEIDIHHVTLEDQMARLEGLIAAYHRK